MKASANQCVYWPGLSSAITNMRLNCTACTGRAPSQPTEPLIISEFQKWPFHKVASEYFIIELHSYFVYADRCSVWTTAYHFKPAQSSHQNLINIVRNLFVDYGIPEELNSDGGPQFTAHAFEGFQKKWGVHHRNSSVNYPKSNIGEQK